MAQTSKASRRDWEADPFLQGVGAGALASAMRADDLGTLSATVQELRSRGADVEALYRAVHPRFPGAPTLDELEQRVTMSTRTSAQNVSQRVIREPRILRGEPTIKGTRVPIRSIVLAYRRYRDVERVCQAYPMLDRAAIEEALAFYAANTEEINEHIAENETDD